MKENGVGSELSKSIGLVFQWNFIMNSKLFSLIAVVLPLAIGCEVPEVEDTQMSTSAPPANVAVQQPASTPATEPVEEVPQPTTGPNEPPAATDTPREVTALDPTRGKKSRAAGGYLGAVAGARFYAEHALIFDQVKQALNLYWGEHGEYPKSHEEFMEKIIKYNQLQLPALDPGVEYLYDPEDHKLKIWRPADAETPPEALERE